MKASLATDSYPVAVSYKNPYYTDIDLLKAGAKLVIREPADFRGLLAAMQDLVPT